MKVLYNPNPRNFRGQVYIMGKRLMQCACDENLTVDKINELITTLQYFSEKERHRIASKRLN